MKPNPPGNAGLQHSSSREGKACYVSNFYDTTFISKTKAASAPLTPFFTPLAPRGLRDCEPQFLGPFEGMHPKELLTS